MARPKTKLGKYCNFYLSNQSIAIILKHSNGKKSQFIDKVLYEFYEKMKNKEDLEREARREVDEIIKEKIKNE
jgi:hypothetical protein